MDWMLLFVAGILGGVLNSIAGGGSFITFPALMFVGVPPIIANATNTFAACAGYLSGTYGFRKDIAKHQGSLFKLVLLSLLGGGAGSYLLLSTSEEQFLHVIPWLLLFATLLFIFGAKISEFTSKMSHASSRFSLYHRFFLAFVLVAVSAYGGFFNAGLGVIVLSYLILAGYQDINLMNGLKLLVSSSVSIVAIVIFVIDDYIDWSRGSVVMLGTLLGGYIAARVSRQVDPSYVRGFVAVSSVVMTIYFFYDVYFT
ncbi:sulfite exporter TauE/SafE family protein [Vibrio sinensis]|uniref:Probable membrane transporter protein n=1 Tax=Vibrio sinensis TaxID=2302434 RepID=A0A3A6R384_9VIBR|nr:sulfite exporter TauE/SafE family protein [Vibrio sinensis]RJX75359.1 sulfite exporter TauE/SafE family protein [Vibrio sinensis]